MTVERKRYYTTTATRLEWPEAKTRRDYEIVLGKKKKVKIIAIGRSDC